MQPTSGFRDRVPSSHAVAASCEATQERSRMLPDVSFGAAILRGRDRHRVISWTWRAGKSGRQKLLYLDQEAAHWPALKVFLAI